MTIVRKPDFVGGGITDDERIQLQAHTEQWINNALRTDHINAEQLIAAIKTLYRTAELADPRVIVVSSPLAMAMAGGYASAIWYMRKTHDTDIWVRENMAGWVQSKDPLHDSILAAAWGATQQEAHDYSDLTPPCDGYAKPAFRDLTKEVFKSDELTEFALDCAKRWHVPYQGGNMWSAYECYLTAFRDVLGLRLPIYDKYKAWEDCAKYGGFRWVHDEFCIVSDFPEVLKIDDQNVPHCEDGPSHRWRDGWELFHWHGVKVEREWIMDDVLTPQIALQQDNLELRRVACEILGWHNILRELDAKVIDKHESPLIGTLLEVNLPDSGPEKFLHVHCPTQREFAIPVPAEMKTAHEANAATWNLRPEEYAPEIET